MCIVHASYICAVGLCCEQQQHAHTRWVSCGIQRSHLWLYRKDVLAYRWQGGDEIDRCALSDVHECAPFLKNYVDNRVWMRPNWFGQCIFGFGIVKICNWKYYGWHIMSVRTIFKFQCEMHGVSRRILFFFVFSLDWVVLMSFSIRFISICRTKISLLRSYSTDTFRCRRYIIVHNQFWRLDNSGDGGTTRH